MSMSAWEWSIRCVVWKEDVFGLRKNSREPVNSLSPLMVKGPRVACGLALDADSGEASCSLGHRWSAETSATMLCAKQKMSPARGLAVSVPSKENPTCETDRLTFWSLPRQGILLLLGIWLDPVAHRRLEGQTVSDIFDIL